MPRTNITSDKKTTYDLDLIAQRIQKLAEIATLEHMCQLQSSQAQGVLDLRHGDGADAQLEDAA